MNRTRTATRIAALLVAPAISLLGALSPALADEGPTCAPDDATCVVTTDPTPEPTPDPTPDPTGDPTPVDCSAYGPDFFPTDDGSCVSIGEPPTEGGDDCSSTGDCLGPPPVVVTEGPDFYPPSDDTEQGHVMIAPGPYADDADDTTGEGATGGSAEADEPAPTPEVSPVDTEVTPLVAQTGDAPAMTGAETDGSSNHLALGVFGLGISLAAVGGLVIRRKLRND